MTRATKKAIRIELWRLTISVVERLLVWVPNDKGADPVRKSARLLIKTLREAIDGEK